jgi:hypothetical protein
MANDFSHPEFGSGSADMEHNARPFPEYQVVATGLTMIYWGIVLMLLMIIGTFALVFAFRNPVQMQQYFEALHWVGTGIYLLSIVGTLLCLTTPKESGATTWLYGSVFFMLIAASISLASSLMDELSPTVESIQQPAQTISSVFFVLFLRRLALHLGAPRLARQAQRVLIAGLILFVLLVVQIALSFGLINDMQQAAPGQARGVAAEGMTLLVIGLSVLVLAIYVIIKYAAVLNDLRKTIRGLKPPE